MATSIELVINDDGSMTVEAGEKEEMGMEEGGKKTPVKSIDEALQVIRKLAESGSVAPTEDQQQNDAMMQGFMGMGKGMGKGM